MGIDVLAAIEIGGGIAYIVALALIAGALPQTPKRLRFSRNCFLAACVLFIGVGLMWGFSTDANFAHRAFIVFALGGLCSVAAMETARFFNEEIQLLQSAKAQEQSPPVDAYSHVPAVTPIDHSTLSAFAKSLKERAEEEHDPVTKDILLKKVQIDPFIDEYMAQQKENGGHSHPRTQEGIDYINRRLRETKAGWQITPENQQEIFGNVFGRLRATGSAGVGLKMEGGGGNIFQDTQITGMDRGVEMKDTSNNRFGRLVVEDKKQPDINVNNSPGSIIAPSGGHNTINNNFAPPDRHLTASQIQAFLAAAAPNGNARIGIRIQDGSNEGRRYASEIEGLLTKAGWDVVGTDGANTLPGDLRGLIIEVGEPIPQAAREIASAFERAGIQYKFSRGPWKDGTDAYRIVIWPI